jgi:periplasmic divalent cation tolerance protein
VTTEFWMVTTTVGDAEAAKALARALVEARLAACVQALPIASTFRWEGAIETACEHLLICKIRAADYAAVEAAIRAKHTYDVPEIVAVPLVAGAAAYLGWLAESTAR